MKHCLYFCILLLLVACHEDVFKYPECRLVSYGKRIHSYGDTSTVRFERELEYDSRDRITIRKNYNFGSIPGGGLWTIDSLVYERGLITEIHTVYPDKILHSLYRLAYRDGLASAIDHYGTRNGSDGRETFLAARETLEYDNRRRLKEVTNVGDADPYPSTYSNALYSYQGDNLSEIHKTQYTIDNAGDTSAIYYTTETYSNYDSLRNPFEGMIFEDLRHRAYSANNYRTFRRITYTDSGDTLQMVNQTKYVEYSEHGYPDVGEYRCNQ